MVRDGKKRPAPSTRRKSRKMMARRQWQQLRQTASVSNNPTTSTQTPVLAVVPDIETSMNIVEEIVHVDDETVAEYNLEDQNSSSSDEELCIETIDEEHEKTYFNITGRRIVDINHLFTSLQRIQHKGFGCTFSDLEIISETRFGLRSEMKFKCKICGIYEKLHTENPNNGNAVNKLAVLGAISIGIGYSQLNELCAAIDIPCLANSTYNTISGEVASAIHEVSWNSMREAGKKETELAVQAGHVNKDGVPIITVVADGAWSKRSYRTNYNALSGVAVVIGAATKQVLFIGVRNKYCSTCERNKLEGATIEHVCFKNWNKTSTAMEADILLEAFRKSQDLHGVIYGRIVADGDSNVYKTLLHESPYGPTFHIQKVECKNHLIRNYITKLTEIKNNTCFSITCRKLLDEKLITLRRAVIRAVNYWYKNDATFASRVLKLREDLIAAPYHVFGDHSRCKSQYFCSEETRVEKQNSGEVNLIAQLQEKDFFAEILKRNKRIVDNAWSLLHNITNNNAESYNALVAKFTGGKRINFSLKGSYTLRCEAAAIAFNCKDGSFHERMQKHLFHSCGNYTKEYCTKQESRKNRTKTGRYKATHNVSGPDHNYGISLEDFPDIEENELQQKRITFMEELRKVDIETIEERTREQALSEIWMHERKIRVTASNFGHVCHMKSTTSTKNLVNNLLYSQFHGNLYTQYGKDNEENAIKQFEMEFKKQTTPCGLFIIKEKPFLAATPDGLVRNENAIVEVKCPASARNLTPLEGVQQKKITFAIVENGVIKLKKNHNYMYQVQGQLYATKADYCYFIIWTPSGIHVEIINKDVDFCKIMVKKLELFYYTALLPEILDPRRLRKLPLRETYLTCNK